MEHDSENLDIIGMIERNSISRLSYDYESKFLSRLKEVFSEKQQQLFVTSFYAYLKYNTKQDFVIDFDTVWKWVGFTRKNNAKTVLNKHFVKDIDYQVLLQPQQNIIGGRPTEKIMVSVHTFKKFCLKSNTKKADEIHDYYILLEEILHQTLDEETNELRLQLQSEKKHVLKVEEEKKEIEEEKKNIQVENEKLTSLLKRKKNEFKKGESLYEGENPIEEDVFKVGVSVDTKSREVGLSTGTTTDFVVNNIWHTQFARIIEDSVKKTFAKYRVSHRKEFYHKEHREEIIAYINKMVDFHKTYEEPVTIIEDEDKTETETDTKSELQPKDMEKFILIRDEDKYVHLPTICKYFGKNFNSFKNSLKNKLELEKLQEENKEDIIKYSFGGEAGLQGSWGNRLVTVHLCNWIAPDIANRVEKYFELLDTLPPKEEEPRKMVFTLIHLMKANFKKESLIKLARSFGLTIGNLNTKRNLADNILNYLSKGDVFEMKTSLLKKCDICNNLKTLDDNNFLKEFQVGFMNTCKVCLVESLTKKEVKTIEEMKIPITDESETKSCIYCSNMFDIRDMNCNVCKFCKAERKHFNETGEIRPMSSVRKTTIEVKEGEKYCHGCKEVLQLNNFHKNGTRLATYCKVCTSKFRKDRRLIQKLQP
jgi:hypothetical protein